VKQPARILEAEDRALVEAALAEDRGAGDWTTECTVPPERRARARIVAKETGVVAGVALARHAFLCLDSDARVECRDDGARVGAGDLVVDIQARARAILTAERVALNFLQHLSGIATLTARYVSAVAGTAAVISDTRKTTPMLRRWEKYAVRCGGGTNHRGRLDEMLLVKENHIAAAGGVVAALQCALTAGRARRLGVEIEVRSRPEFDAALALAPDRILLDHWTPDDVAAAVRARGDRKTPRLEVSGNLSLDTIAAYARAGADILSVGAITHSAPALDLSLLVDAEPA